MTTPQDPYRSPSEPAGQAPVWGETGPVPGYGPPPVAGYGPPPVPGTYAGYPVQETSTKAIIALVLAIASFVVFPLVPAIVALVLASGALDEIDASGGRMGGTGLVTAAKVVSWINIGLCALVFLLAVGALVLFASVGFS